MLYVFVFLAMAILDSFWAFYIKRVNDGRAIQAGMWSGAIMLFSSFVTMNYVRDPKMVIPAILGAFIGTALSVRRKQKRCLTKSPPRSFAFVVGESSMEWDNFVPNPVLKNTDELSVLSTNGMRKRGERAN